MIQANSSMKKRELTDLLATEYGVEAPAGSNKATVLDLLAAEGCAIVDAEAEDTGTASTKPKRYVINLFKEKGEKGDVTGCVNGKAYVLPRGKNIEVSEAIYTTLKNAVKLEGEPIEEGGVEMFERQAYPFSLVEIK